MLHCANSVRDSGLGRIQLDRNQPNDRDRQRAQQIRNAAQAVSSNPRRVQDTIAAMTAQDILHEDLGWDDERPPNNFYNLDKDTQDCLIALARQDVAHAVLTAGQTLDVVHGIRRRLKWIGIAVSVIAVCLGDWADFIASTNTRCRPHGLRPCRFQVS